MPATTELLQKGRYRLDSSPSQNGTSNAYDTLGDSKVIVKEMAQRMGKVTTLSQQEAIRNDFEKAANRLITLRHENLVHVVDSYSEVGRNYLVLEHVEGDDFQVLMAANRRPFAIEDVLKWADQLLDCLNYLHNQKPPVLHGKLSPSAIRLTVDGVAKLHSLTVKGEEGAALSTDISDTSGFELLNYSPLEIIWESLDAASQKVITNSYDERAERLLKEPADARCDLYSLGATLYHLLTGQMPVDPLERSIELLEGKADPLKAPDKVNSLIAPEISDVIMRALEIRRENRFDSAVIMRQVLRTAAVRVKEREEDEAEELADAAEVLKGTQKLKLPEGFVPPASALAAAQERPINAELPGLKVAEADEVRPQPEQRPAEPHLLPHPNLAEQERGEARQPATSIEHLLADDDLLGLIEISDAPNYSPEPVSASFEIAAVDQNPVDQDPVDHDRVAQVAEPEVDEPPVPREEQHGEIETVEADVTSKPEHVTEYTVPAEPVAEELEPEIEIAEVEVSEEADQDYLVEETDEASAADLVDDLHNSVATANDVHETDDVPFSSVEQQKSLPIPMIAGVAAVLLIAAVGGWMFLGGSSAPSAPSTVREQPASQAAPQQAIVSPEQTPSSTDDARNPALPETPGEQNAFTSADQTPDTPAAKPSVKQASKPKPSAEAAKTPAPKKPVTVDDLINDN